MNHLSCQIYEFYLKRPLKHAFQGSPDLRSRYAFGFRASGHLKRDARDDAPATRTPNPKP